MTEIIIKPSGDNGKKRGQVEARIAYILMKAGVTAAEIDPCIKWAFGKDAWYVPIWPDWVNRWHKLHPQAFRVKHNDNFVEWIYVIGFLFCVEKEKAKLKAKGGSNAKIF